MTYPNKTVEKNNLKIIAKKFGGLKKMSIFALYQLTHTL
jgi:hypothetical protein